MSEQDLDFEAAMRALGVRPTRKDGGRAVASSRESQGAAATRRTSRSATPARTPPTRPAVRPNRSLTPPAKPQTSDLSALRADVARLTRALQKAKEALLEHQEEVAELSAALEAQVARPVPPAPSNHSVPATFRARGIWGEDEAWQVIQGLQRAGLFGDLLARLAPTDPTAFDDWLREHTVLLGECPHCPDGGSRAVLRVPHARCEVCGGSDIRRTGRHFIDQFLACGFTRLTVVGGSPKYHLQLRAVVAHHRITLRMVPGRSRRTRRQAREDIQGSDLVVLWRASQFAEGTSEHYTAQAGEGRVLVMPHRDISSMLQAVTQAIASI